MNARVGDIVMEEEREKPHRTTFSEFLVPFSISIGILLFFFIPFALPSFMQSYTLHAKNVDAQIYELHSPVANNRAIAASYLGRFGKVSEKALPDLFKRLNDPDYWVRTNSAYAIAKIGLTEDTIVLVKDVLQKDDTEILEAILGAAIDYGKKTDVLTGELVELLFYRDGYVSDLAREALSKLSSKAEIKEELFSKLYNLEDEKVEKAIRLIYMHGGDNPEDLAKIKEFAEEKGDEEIIKVVENLFWQYEIWEAKRKTE